MLTSQNIKTYAKQCGADLISLGTLDRFDGTPKEKDPRYIAPQAKTIIGLGFRVLRGSLRGNVEGTQFFQYPEMSVVHLDEVYIPMVLRKLACFIEDGGYEAVPLRSEPDRKHVDDSETNPERTPVSRFAAVAVREGNPPPDVMIDFNEAAVRCGLGEMGLGGFVLTSEFGPLQRFAFILTDAELEPDPIISEGLCDNCRKCMEACPGHAYFNGTERTLHLPSIELHQDYLVANTWQCAAYYMGADYASNPFVDVDALRSLPDGDAILAGEKRFDATSLDSLQAVLEAAYPGMRFGYNTAICGRACWRACLNHLEQRNILKKTYAHALERNSIEEK